MSCGCGSKRVEKSWDSMLGSLFSTKLKEEKKEKIVGGRVTMPSEYYGKNSGRYSSCQTQLEPSAYGPNFGTSHGTLIGKDACGLSIIGPDLGPAPYATTTQTGGKRKSKRKSNKRKSKSNKRRMSKRK